MEKIKQAIGLANSVIMITEGSEKRLKNKKLSRDELLYRMIYDLLNLKNEAKLLKMILEKHF